MYTLQATKYISHNVTECMYHVPALVTQRSYEPTHLRKHTSHFPRVGDINGSSICANTNYAAVVVYIPIWVPESHDK
jgi:predicted lipase